VTSAAAHSLAPDEATALRLVAEEDVVGDAESVDEVELLVDGRDAGLHRLLRAAERDRLAEPLALPGVRGVRTGQDLDERGLAGPVLAEQAVHLAGPDL